jgi:hypothetical protein
LGLGIQERQHLRIEQEQVDIVTFTMVDLQHEGGAAAESPFGNMALRGLEMIEDAGGDAEERGPLARPLFDHRRQAARARS